MRRKNILIAAGFAAAAIGILLWAALQARPGHYVRIQVAGVVQPPRSLRKAEEIVIRQPDGKQNILHIGPEGCYYEVFDLPSCTSREYVDDLDDFFLLSEISIYIHTVCMLFCCWLI